jgi:DNA-binding NtrC family response regulator
MVNSAKKCSEGGLTGIGAGDREAERGRSAPRPQALAEAGDGLRDRLRHYEVKLILEALEASRGNQTEAARRLKVPLRTLAHKMKILGIRRRGYEAGP